jgi:hypothetical protein
MDQKIETDPFLQLLTDALRAGPGSPQWHQAVARIKAGETGPEDEYALLVQARENLASGKDYRSVRAGAGFTRKLFAGIETGEETNRKSPISASMISYLGAGLFVGVLAMLLFYLTSSNGPGSTEDLSDLFFSNTIDAANFDGPLSPQWRLIGPLQVDPAKGLQPAWKSSNDYVGGGVVSVTGGRAVCGRGDVSIPARERRGGAAAVCDR